MTDDIWEAKPPVQLIAAVSIVAVIITLDAIALGATMQTGMRSPEPPGALAIALACGQVAIAAMFFTLGNVGFARQGLLLLAAVAYGGALVAAGATIPTGTMKAIRWDAGCGELFILACLLAVPGALLRLFGVRLVHKSVPLGTANKPWQFSLEGSLALLTAVACFFAALRWITTSKTSGVGVILEWMLLAWIPWMCFALICLPLHPIASFGGLWVLIGIVALVAYLFGPFLGRPAMGLTAGAQAIVCALLLFALRWSGYRLAIVPRGAPPA
jgi:hypothetical protein